MGAAVAERRDVHAVKAADIRTRLIGHGAYLPAMNP